MRLLFYIVCTLLTVTELAAQLKKVDSVRNELAVSQNDTLRLILCGKMAALYTEENPDSSYRYATEMIELAQKFNLKLEKSFGLGYLGYAFLNKRNYPRALNIFITAKTILEDPSTEDNLLPARFEVSDEFSNRMASARVQRITQLARLFQFMGALYVNEGFPKKGLNYFMLSSPLAKESGNLPNLCVFNILCGRCFLLLNRLDSALYHFQQAQQIAETSGYTRYLGSILLNIGRVYQAQANKDLAKVHFVKALQVSESNGYYRGMVASCLALSEHFSKSDNQDSALYYVRYGLPVANYLNAPNLLERSYILLANHYTLLKINDSIVKYQALLIQIKDSQYNSRQAQEFQNIDFDQQMRAQDLAQQKAAILNRNRINMLVAGICVFLLIALMLYRNNRQKQKVNRLLGDTLSNLKSAQAQLIQSEKMASLGEMTAGIAHEIRNPLNFVNNFSELNQELISELQVEIDRGNMDDVKIIAYNIKENETKISMHGKKADAIVQGMLEHSRISSGQHEPTDINTLADEYLRLSYHGFQARDKSMSAGQARFIAQMETDFDPAMGKVNIVTRDIARVLLNLFNNAFYAVDEKQKQSIEGYQPTVSVSTKKVNGNVEISIADNGNGIPEKVLDKVFQPFFTTKPTGQGTGLGLSLSYDIIKAHGGSINIRNTPGAGAEFIITLPVNI